MVYPLKDLTSYFFWYFFSTQETLLYCLEQTPTFSFFFPNLLIILPSSDIADAKYLNFPVAPKVFLPFVLHSVLLYQVPWVLYYLYLCSCLFSSIHFCIFHDIYNYLLTIIKNMMYIVIKMIMLPTPSTTINIMEEQNFRRRRRSSYFMRSIVGPLRKIKQIYNYYKNTLSFHVYILYQQTTSWPTYLLLPINVTHLSSFRFH